MVRWWCRHGGGSSDNDSHCIIVGGEVCPKNLRKMNYQNHWGRG